MLSGGAAMSGDDDGKWLDAHYDPLAGLRTFTSCVALADLSGDGDARLVAADLGGGHRPAVKLKVYQGTALSGESVLLDLPCGLVTFFMDLHEPRVPAVAVASGSCVYVYKNLRPYFKFTLPGLGVDESEQDAWREAREGRIDPPALKELLESLRNKSDAPLSARSLRFLSTDAENLEDFVRLHGQQPVKRQTVITCISTLKKSTADEDGVSCLLIGTESAHLYVLDPEAFIILAKMSLPAPPTAMDVTGQFDVEFRITAACRDGNIYVLRRDSERAKYRVELTSHPVGLLRVGKNVVVGTADRNLQAFTQKLWKVTLPAAIRTMAPMELPARGLQAVLVALANCEVHLYRDKNLLSTVKTPAAVSAVRFGRYGREDGTLVMSTEGGGLMVKILKRTAEFRERDGAPGPPAAQSVRLDVPKKTKLYVDQTLREREHGAAMHRAFRMDLARLRLAAARAYARALESSLAPVSSGPGRSLKINAAVRGLGPSFELTLGLQNTAACRPLLDLAVSFLYDPASYRVRDPLLKIPMLLPGPVYPLRTLVECVGDVSDVIKVFVLAGRRSAPLLTAHINMPAGEGAR
ncbi:Bardet-Biedl syndrome 1 protein isoform X2 [Corythoichthys intestinalis]|uniref:Bardet-Biedl syndrome 1 protein isoform X2 n=1 Tax=Corythoichthys intestinalis TaxID=161448 RepID=UPI0025A5A243|nr:Bardet-Biedl syndrome 1 protein isoform X2 [Corythoichthys intestinalis]